MSNPKKPSDMGMNRTGIGLSPIDAKKSADGAKASVPNPVPDSVTLTTERTRLSSQVEPVGTMPPPVSVKGAAKAAVQAIKGNKPTVFLDLIGERLAFERTGTRLYEALLSKFDAADIGPGGPTRDQIESIRNDELAHFALLKGALEKLGADPTAVTPSADIGGVASMGLLQVVTDPRVTLTEALRAILIAELADNDAWMVLADVASRLGHDELSAEFQQALVQEEDHLARVRNWLTSAIEGQAGLEPQLAGTGLEPPSPV